MLGLAFALFARFSAKVTLRKNVFFDLLHLIYSMPGEKRVKYANRMSTSRFSIARDLALSIPYFYSVTFTRLRAASFPILRKGYRPTKQMRNRGRLNRCITSPAFAFARTNRKNCGRGFENTMEINLPSLTNPEAHKAAGGNDGTSC